MSSNSEKMTRISLCNSRWGSNRTKHEVMKAVDVNSFLYRLRRNAVVLIVPHLERIPRQGKNGAFSPPITTVDRRSLPLSHLVCPMTRWERHRR